MFDVNFVAVVRPIKKPSRDGRGKARPERPLVEGNVERSLGLFAQAFDK